jgi:hypothetical protein
VGDDAVASGEYDPQVPRGRKLHAPNNRIVESVRKRSECCLDSALLFFVGERCKDPAASAR